MAGPIVFVTVMPAAPARMAATDVPLEVREHRGELDQHGHLHEVRHGSGDSPQSSVS